MTKHQIVLLVILITSAQYVLPWSHENITHEIQSQCDIESRVNITEDSLDSSGFAVQFGYVFPPESIWTEDGDIFACHCYNRSKCLPLACSIGIFVYYQLDMECEEYSNPTEDQNQTIIAPVPSVYPANGPNGSAMVNLIGGDYMEYSYGDCEWVENDTAIGESLQNGVCVRSNGTVYIPTTNYSVFYNFDSYCRCRGVRFKTRYSETLLRGIVYTIIDHVDLKTGNMTGGATMLSHVGIIISIPFLLVTFIVYSILPEMRNIHGLTLRGYVGCLLVAYITLAVIRTVGPVSDTSCLFFAFTIHFSFLASFFWLNAMCFDIWWTFGGFRSLRGKVERGDRKKFFMYSAYALGSASLLTGTCMIMDLVPGIPDGLIRPDFGVDGDCWFKTDEAKALYFYGPMGITIICNIFFFVTTAVKIIRHRKNTAHHLKGENSKRHDDNKQWFNLYLKLFIVMGINWSMEIFSWLYKDLEYLWYMTDLGNALQGLIIFVIFICKKNVMRLLFKRFGCRGPNFLSQDSKGNKNRSLTSETAITSASRSM